MAPNGPVTPRRRITDHVHPEYWGKSDHDRFEDRVSEELKELREDVHALSSRLAWLLGGIAVLVFLIGILGPMIQGLLDLPVQ